MQVLNRERNIILAADTKEAVTFVQRLKGLMFTKELPNGSALHIQPCRTIHTFFMNYCIDVIYLDAQRRIVGLEQLSPRKIGSRFSQASSVLELPAGTIALTGTEVGNTLIFQT